MYMYIYQCNPYCVCLGLSDANSTCNVDHMPMYLLLYSFAHLLALEPQTL
jgi:hypothetical protein